jgi:urease accessory protein
VIDSLTSPIAPGWQGSLQLTYAVHEGSTQMVHSRSQAPFKLQRSFYPEDPAICHSVILHTAGGMVGGDRLAAKLHLQPNAHALITTAAAAKIYGSTGSESQQTVEIEIGEGGGLEWLPQETIVFDRALHRQAMRVNLAAGTTWLGWEITRFGRSARAEKFTQGDWRSHTEIWQAGVPLWIDRQWLPGSQAIFHSPHGLAGCPVVGSFAFVGQVVTPELVQQVRSLWTGQGEVGATRLRSGLLCRYRGASSSEARRWFLQVWRVVRLAYFDRDLCIPRVWQLSESERP